MGMASYAVLSLVVAPPAVVCAVGVVHGGGGAWPVAVGVAGHANTAALGADSIVKGVWAGAGGKSDRPGGNRVAKYQVGSEQGQIRAAAVDEIMAVNAVYLKNLLCPGTVVLVSVGRDLRRGSQNAYPALPGRVTFETF